VVQLLEGNILWCLNILQITLHTVHERIRGRGPF
jgi:hypothetical protein